MKWLTEPWCVTRDIGRNYSSRREHVVDSIVLHYTTGGSYLDTEAWFRHPDCRSSSAHFVVGRNGQIDQLVPLDMAAWHAGDGLMLGSHANPNLHSVGIEIANHGLLRPRSGGGWETDWGLEYDQRKYTGPVRAVLRYDDGLALLGMWEPYPALQVGAVALLVRTLVQAFGVPLNRIVGHQDVAPSIKSDPGPLFPWSQVREGLQGPLGDGKRYRRTRP